jgi:integrin alpha FG-GAP repeat containing protein 1
MVCSPRLVFFVSFIVSIWCGVGCEKSPLNPWDSNAPEFHDPGLYHVNVGLSNMNAFVAAVGDFDSDRYVDVFLVSNDRSWMQVMSWLTSEYVFDTKGNIIFETGIVNVVPVDVNHDGEMDAVLMTKNETGTFMHFYLADHSDLSKHSSNGPFEGQPLVLDIDGDLEVEFLGVLKGEGERKVWKFREDSGLIEVPLPSGIAHDGALSDPHGAATVDLNGDCVADLVLFSKQVATRGNTDTTNEERVVAEMYVRHGSKAYSHSHDVTLPLGAGVPSFDDVDGDGNVDLIFPVCYPPGTCAQERSIHIIFNQQNGMCRKSTSHGCRDPDDLCQSASFSFDSNFPTDDHIVIDLGSWKPLAVPSMEDVFPPRMRFGDLNLDGHPDALIVLKSDDGDYHSVFFMNVKHNNRRSLQRRESGHYEEIFNIPNAVSASFVDLDETGALDIIVNQLGSSKGMMQISVLFNNLFFDAYFLKSLALNGICASWCSDGAKFPQPKVSPN